MTTASGDRITIMLVDDHALVRDGLRRIFETQSDFEVVAEAGDSHAAVSLATRHRPDVVLLDVEIPGDHVTTTVRRIREATPDTEVVVLSVYDSPELVGRLLDLGIRGYLLKSATWHQLVAAVRGAGHKSSAVLLAVSMDSLSRMNAPPPRVLSPRELDVLRLAAEARTNLQIARSLHLSEATVKRHLRSIFAKLNAVSRIDAVNKAVAASLIGPPNSKGNTSVPRRRPPMIG
ncbi:response regulator transcription factor [Jidongwangia harbinensis]|uniref:response regulator transcription factor n=1 Tax=Jidongwangia harbinensis TaxID=2878561 RepID=UPI001CDA2EE5|nr:response regulator transcription factor [Jidongwangia harbinensis]MCA2219201.1 response regulator transcription factor [Jidongwangia harbinensis]